MPSDKEIEAARIAYEQERSLWTARQVGKRWLAMRNGPHTFDKTECDSALEASGIIEAAAWRAALEAAERVRAEQPPVPTMFPIRGTAD